MGKLKLKKSLTDLLDLLESRRFKQKYGADYIVEGFSSTYTMFYYMDTDDVIHKDDPYLYRISYDEFVKLLDIGEYEWQD